ncbi:MAG TPA: hypothetical protein DEA43_03080 [Candidatus Moranbacteria bacterium]|nr:hypothetical protein [Candidatus Moranbacteria bacterium]HBT45838.1 hypothetical protein [Candidatus Moranbacteria bacterium]
MAKKVTGKKAASAASKVLRSGSTSKNSKTAAASALSQREKSIANYACPNCGSSKSTLRGRCSVCGYAGLR